MAFSPTSFLSVNYRDFKNYWLKVYEPGTTTPKVMAIDSTGTPTVAKFELNKDGFIESAGGALVIPFVDDSYDAWLFPTEPEADANDTTNAERIADNITGVNGIGSNNANVKTFDTLALAVAETDVTKMFEGAALNIKERTPGNDGGAMWDAVLSTSVTENPYDIVQCVGIPTLSVVLRKGHKIIASQYGAATGVDDSTLVQAIIDLNKGRYIQFDKGYAVKGVTLDDSTYNSTELESLQSLILVQRVDGSDNTFGGAFIGILIKDCDGVVATIRMDGNRLNQPDEEHVYCMAIAGGSNHHFPFLEFNQIRGDGIYISQSDFLVDTQSPLNLTFGTVKGRNSVDDGRNLMSIVSAIGLTVENLFSNKIGGVIATVTQPGGLDIEPNFSYQDCRDIVIGNANVESIGTVQCGIFGTAAGSSPNWTVSNVTFGNIITSGICKINGAKGVTATSINAGRIDLDELDGCKINGVVTDNTASPALSIGAIGFVKDSEINIVVEGYTGVAIRTTGFDRSKLTGRVNGATTGSSTFGLQLRSLSRAIAQTDVIYSVDIPFDGLNSRGIRNETVDLITDLSTCSVENCDLTGYASHSVQVDASISSIDVKGRNLVTVQPGNGQWVQGDFVKKSNPTLDGNNMTLSGFIRLTTSGANVSGTDWANAYVSHVTPAT